MTRVPQLRPTRVVLDREALGNNLRILRSWVPVEEFFCPMIKANAYGHGDCLVAQFMEQSPCKISAMGVALIEEGVRLRSKGVRLPVLVFAPFDRAGLQTMLENKLTPVAGRLEDLEALSSLETPDIQIHLKLNTGMQRLGFVESEITALRNRLQLLPHVKIQGVCTHLTHGHEILQINGPSREQMALFERLSEGLPGVRHLHKTASLAELKGAPVLPKSYGARPGIGIYGLPHEGRCAAEGLKPVLTWLTSLVRIHLLEKGQSVGYGARWTAPRRTVLGVVPVGYADGYMRILAGKAQMLWRGRRVPVVGSVCMDYILLDLTEGAVDGIAQPGESVVVIGRQGDEEITAIELAEKAGTIAYEVVTVISGRVPRELSKS